MPKYLTARKDLERHCRRCERKIRKGETYRAAGYDIGWFYTRRWVHQKCEKGEPDAPSAVKAAR